jgi:hypothetical protein
VPTDPLSNGSYILDSLTGYCPDKSRTTTHPPSHERGTNLNGLCVGAGDSHQIQFWERLVCRLKHWCGANCRRKASVLFVAFLVSAVSFGAKAVEKPNIVLWVGGIPHDTFRIKAKSSDPTLEREVIAVNRLPPNVELFCPSCLKTREHFPRNGEESNARNLFWTEDIGHAWPRNSVRDVTPCPPRTNSWCFSKAYRTNFYLHVFSGDISSVDPLRNEIPQSSVANDGDILQENIGSVCYPRCLVGLSSDYGKTNCYSYKGCRGESSYQTAKRIERARNFPKVVICSAPSPCNGRFEERSRLCCRLFQYGHRLGANVYVCAGTIDVFPGTRSCT